jgi:predicted alpha/beta superfamily hydrolase
MRFIQKNTLLIGLVTLALSSNSLWASEASEKNNANIKVDNKAETIKQTFGQGYSFESNLLGEKRELMIHLPKGYQTSSQKYPVLYVLDGASHFKHAVLASSTLAQYGMMPQTIIVAIPNNTRKRNRDVSSGRANFSAFITQEVMPYVNENYRTTGLNSLFGHSAMGFVTLEMFATKLASFDNYIAASPAVGHSVMEQIEKLLAQDKLNNKSLYFTATDKAREIAGFTEGAISLAKLFKDKAPGNLALHYEFIPGQQHMTTPYLTLYQGLAKAFSD